MPMLKKTTTFDGKLQIDGWMSLMVEIGWY